MIRRAEQVRLARLSLTLIGVFLVFFATAFFLAERNFLANAVQKEDWKAGNIISDAIFTDAGNMSVSDIQSFLDQKIGSCDVWGTGKASEYGSSQTRAQYAAARGWAGPPYTCLNKYYEVPKLNPGGDLPANNYSSPDTIPSGAQSAAWIIKDAATRFNISPKVLLVKIATESIGPLTSDNWPLFSQYRYAMGSHCPDSGPNGSANCDSNYAGFSIQMYSAAQLMRWYLDSMNQPWWSYKKPYQTNSVMWNVSERGCGAGNVYIENKATAALYTYTPYQPNQAALNNLYGSGDTCSAYGNRNFWRVYNDWFGSSTIQILNSFGQRYQELGGATGVLGEAATNQICGLINGGCYQGFKNGGIYWSLGSGTFESYGPLRERYVEMGAERSALVYPNEAVICGLKDSGCYQRYQGGVIYYSPKVGHAYENAGNFRTRYIELGTETGALGYPASGQICGLRENGCYQGYESGGMYQSKAGTFENYGAIRERYVATGTESGALGYPTSNQQCGSKNGGCYQQYQGGAIYQSTQTGAHALYAGIYAKWDEYSKEWGPLGYPKSDEIYGTRDGGSYQIFEGGYIYWTGTRAYVVLNQVASRWQELGSEWGKLGYPISDTVCGSKNGGCYQIFGGGNAIYWSQSTGAKTVWGGFLIQWKSLNAEWGRLGYPTSNEYGQNGQTVQDFENGTISWDQSGGPIRVTYR